MACYDSDGNEISCSDGGGDDGGAPPPDNGGGDGGGDQGAGDPGSGDQGGGDQGPLAPNEISNYGGGTTDQSGVYNPPTPGFGGDAPMAPPSDAPPGNTDGLASGPAPGTPGGPQAPTPGPAPGTPGGPPVPTVPRQPQVQLPPNYPDYSAVYQAQIAANAEAQRQLLEFERSKWNQEFGLQQSQFETSKQQWQQEFDLKTTIANADNAYKQALINTQNVQLAQQAMRDSMTRDFQQQELSYRNQALAQSQGIEREKLDLQRRLLPVTRTARRAATVTTI